MSYRPAICGFSVLLVSLMPAASLAQAVVDIASAPRPATQPAPARPAIVPMTVEGVVIDQDYKPIQNARVLLMRTSTGAELKTSEATTDTAGRFKIEGDSTMRMVVVHAPGFGIGGDQVPAPSTTVGSTTPPKPTVIVMSPAADVRIKVLDPDGKPAAGIVVNFSGDGVNRARTLGRGGYLISIPRELESHFKQTTDAQGIATFKDWPQDCAAVVDVEDDRYAHLSSSELVTIQRSALTEHTLQLEKASSLSGRVAIEDGKAPVAGIQLQLAPVNQNDPMFRIDIRPAETDAEGKYSFRRLTAGEYELIGTLPPALASKFAPPAMSGINLPKGAAYDGIDLLLNAGVTISGKVTARDGGAPLPNVRIQVRDPQSRYSNSSYVTTGEDGSYTMHTAPGDRMFTVQPVYTGPTPPTTRYDAISRTITIAASQTTPIDFQLAPSAAAPLRTVLTTADGVTLSGTVNATRGARGATPAAAAPAAQGNKVKGAVVDSAGKSVPYAVISVEAPVDRNNPDAIFSGRISRPGDSSMRADGEGKFELQNVQPGSLLRAQTLKLASLKGTPVPANDQEVKLVVQPEGMGSARVKIVDVDGKPLQGASLNLIIATSESGGISLGQDTRTTGDDGTWTFTSLLSDGTYTIQANAKGFGRASTKAQVQSNPQEEIITLKRADSFIAGLALDDGGNPLPNARIRVVGQSTGSQIYVKTDDAGSFRVEKLVKDEAVTVYLVDGNRMLTSQRGVAGKDELIVLQRPLTPTPVGGRAGGRGAAQ